MKNLVIEQGTLATVLKKAVESGEIVKCDRCGVSVLADEMFGPVCNDCAMDLVEDGLEREEEALVEEAMEEIEEALEALALAVAMKDSYEKMTSYGVPIGAIDLDFFL